GYVQPHDGALPKPIDGKPDLERRDGKDVPKPLNTWLADELDAMAGLQPRDQTTDQRHPEPPLTLGHLADEGIALKMFTTNLTEGTPYTLPFSQRKFFFDPQEFRRYFPERIVQHMEDNSADRKHALSTSERQDWDLARTICDRLVPLPDARDMPVVVVTRFSLSFPILLSAVPLWRVFPDDAVPRVPRNCWLP